MLPSVCLHLQAYFCALCVAIWVLSVLAYVWPVRASVCLGNLPTSDCPAACVLGIKYVLSAYILFTSWSPVTCLYSCFRAQTSHSGLVIATK